MIRGIGPVYAKKLVRRGEFSLTALAYNLRRVLNIVELPKLIAALPP
jgi:hypothetical protein